MGQPFQPISPVTTGGVLKVATASAVIDAEKANDAERTRDQTAPEIVGLLGYLLSIWQRNLDHKKKSGVQDQMLDNLRARDSQYSETKLQSIVGQGLPDIFMGLTNVKCAHAEAWMLDIFSSSERPWGLEPTPEPEASDIAEERIVAMVRSILVDRLQQGEEFTPEKVEKIVADLEPIADEVAEIEIKERAKAMEDKIYDQFYEGGWDDAFDDMISDVVTLKAGIIKGPIIRRHKQKKWERGTNNEWKRVTKDRLRPEYERVSPFDMFPSPEAVEIRDGNLVERMRLSRQDLIDLKGEDGYDEEAIDEVLTSFDMAHEDLGDTTDPDRAILEDRETDRLELLEDIEALEYWVSVQGKTLKEHGVEEGPDRKKLEDLAEYNITAITANQKLIFWEFAPEERIYSKTGWRKVPGSFWYKGVPELMQDLQKVCNASMRALVYNMSIASGPQAIVDMSRLASGEDVESIFPGKVWQTYNKGNVTSKAIDFFQPDLNAAELLGIYDRFAELADDYTGIPAYAYGNDDVAGAGRTSSGLSMLMTSAAKGIKRVIMGLDKNIFRTVVERQFDWNMEFVDDDAIKGDVNIVTTGAVAVMVKEQMAQRRMEFLNATNNPVDLELVGAENRANVLREVARSLEIAGSKAVKDPDEIRDAVREREQAQLQQAQAEAQRAEAEARLTLQNLEADLRLKRMEEQTAQVESQVKLAEMQLKRDKLEMDARQAGLEISLKSEDLRIKKQGADASSLTAGTDATLKSLEALEAEVEPDVEEASLVVDEGV